MLFATIHHNSGAGHDNPLPVREAVTSSCAGHDVCLWDWAMLEEMLMSRFPNGATFPFDAYPWGTSYYGLTHPQMVEMLMASDVSSFMDSAWTPTGEMFDGDAGEYDLLGLHGFARASQSFAATTPAWRKVRKLDDMRRHFYDVKRMTRIVLLTSGSLTIEGGNTICFGYNAADDSEYSYDVTALSVSGIAAKFPEAVRTASGFSVTPRWILGRFRIVDGETHEGYTGARNLTAWIPLNADGTADLTACNAAACRTVFDQYVTRRSGTDQWVACLPFRRSTRTEFRIVCDVTYPNDGIMVPWRWTPTD